MIRGAAQAIRLETGGTGRTFFGVEHSLTGRRWAERLGAAGSVAATAIAQKHALPDVIARVLAGRDVPVDDVPGFLDPTLRRLMPDPAVLTDMSRAAERIAAAITAGEPIAIFGDYDVDGAASAALFARFLRAQGRDATIYIPDRIFEGYGPNVEAMRSLAAKGARLVIAVDCGTGSFEAIEAANALGVDTVVIDHHQTGAALPPAYALVNPNRQDDLSGLGYLAAAGVTFLTLVAINRRLRVLGWYGSTRAEPDLLGWLDLVALATVCDVVPLIGLNRAFVTKGLLTSGAAREPRPRGACRRRPAERSGGPLRPRLPARPAHQRGRADRRCGSRCAAAREQRSA